MCSVPSSASHERIFRAGWVVVSSSEIIQNGYIEIEKGRIRETGRFSKYRKGATEVIDLGSGIIFPGLINCHTHLELSFLKNKIDTSQGFRKWVQKLIALRNSTTEKIIIEAARRSLADAFNSGTAFIGDISTMGLSPAIFSDSPVAGIGFREFLGSFTGTEYRLPVADSDDAFFSLAAHAPHTTSPELMGFLKKTASDNKMPFSIHLDESDDEREFIKNGKGEWADFLASRNIDYSSWPVPSESPVVYAEKAGILDSRTLCVHLCGSSEKDLDIIKKKNAKVCLCPRSNINLHGILPDVEKMILKGIRPCLGTDSLASTGSLSLFDEIRFLYKKFPNISPSTLFEMATINGASALGVSDSFGTLEQGKKAFMIYSDSAPLSEPGIFDSFVLSKTIEVL